MGSTTSKNLYEKLNPCFTSPENAPDLLTNFIVAVAPRVKWDAKEAKDLPNLLGVCLQYQTEQNEPDVDNILLACMRVGWSATASKAASTSVPFFRGLCSLIRPGRHHYSDKLLSIAMSSISEVLVCPEGAPSSKRKQCRVARDTAREADLVEGLVTCITVLTTNKGIYTHDSVCEHARVLDPAYTTLAAFAEEDAGKLMPAMHTALRVSCYVDDTIRVPIFKLILSVSTILTSEDMFQYQLMAIDTKCYSQFLAVAGRLHDTQFRRDARRIISFLVDGSEPALKLMFEMLPPQMIHWLEIGALNFTPGLSRQIRKLTKNMTYPELDAKEIRKPAPAFIGDNDTIVPNWEQMWFMYDKDVSFEEYEWNEEWRSSAIKYWNSLDFDSDKLPTLAFCMLCEEVASRAWSKK